MNNLSLRHNNYFTKNNTQRKILKQKALENCFNVKKSVNDTQKHLLNDISVEMQKLLNQGKLTHNHFENFVEKMQANNIHPELCEQFLVNMLVLINHNTTSDTKINWGGWFGCVNKTDSLKIFLNVDSKNLTQYNKNNFSGFLQLNYLAHIYGIIGHKYNNIEYHMKSQNAYHNLINYYNDLESKLLQTFKDKYFEQSDLITKLTIKA